MQIIKQNVGVEVDSKTLQLAFYVLDENLDIHNKGRRKFSNTTTGFKDMEKWIESKRIGDTKIHLTMEATGVYSENVSYHFCENDKYSIHIILPNVARAYFNSYNMKSKTDDIDAHGLARLGLERKLAEWKPASEQMRRIRKLSRSRLQLVKAKTMTTNQLHAEQSSHKPEKLVVQTLKSHLKFLEKQIKKLEDAMHIEVQKDEHLSSQINNICQAPGIGFITAIGVMAELDSFSMFKNRSQIVSFCGYDVVKKESGSSVRGKERISKKGNSRVRKMLYMAAMSAVRFDEHHKDYYQRIVRKTGIKMKGNVAIQRKLLLLIFALSNPENVFDKKHPHRMQEELKKRQKQKVEQSPVPLTE